MTDAAESTVRQQSEAARFRSAVSEALLQQMQGNINFLLSAVLPIGSVINSMLTEAQFQDETSTKWILADGRNVAGSAYAILTGFTTVPDCRGVVVRGKDNSRGADSGGERALGSYQADAIKSHHHSIIGNDTGGGTWEFPALAVMGAGGVGMTPGYNEMSSNGVDPLISDTGGAENIVKNVCLNRFIRIN